MQLLAHRGYHAKAPENTLQAFEAAVELGVDGIETDVRMSRDGLPVIMHDRVTPQRRPVAELTRREIENDVGHPVPLLAEILDAFTDVLWNIEIKNPEAYAVSLPVLKQFQRQRRLFVTSFRHDVVLQCASELETDCGLLLAHRPVDVSAIIAGCTGHSRINAIVWDYNIVDARVLDVVSAASWSNYVYGAVTLPEHRGCESLGLAGLITDYPPLVLDGRS